MQAKIITSTLVLLTLLCSNLIVSANIIDDIKNNFQTSKNKIKDEAKQIKNQANLEIDQVKKEVKNICETQKSYLAKHFENRKLERTKEIAEKLTKITRVKTLLNDSRQDLTAFNETFETLTKSLKQKTEFLKDRTTEVASISCSDSQKTKSYPRLQEFNQSIDKLDKEIHNQTRDFGLEVQRLIIKINALKVN